MFHLRVAEAVFAQLGNARVDLSANDRTVLAELTDAGVEAAALMPFVLTKHRFDWAGLGVTIDGETVCVSGLPQKIARPEGASRGRKVSIVAWWRTGNGGVRHSPKLASLAPLCDGSSKAQSLVESVLAELRAADTPALATWVQDIVAGMPEDSRLALLLPSLRTGADHNGTSTSSAAKLPIRHDSSALDEHWGTCGSCHSKALEQWRLSRHYIALHTLVGRQQHTDLRCTTCHTSFDVGQASGAAHLAAVTCQSCHMEAGKATVDMCAQCHTPLTDPMGHYLKRVKDICGGPQDSPQGQCNR